MTDKQLRQAEKRIADLELMVSLGEDRENELEQALSRANTQYEKVVEQNQSLQQENKQLKRKEQECGNLKKEQSEIKKYLGISHKTILERLKELTEFRDQDREQLDQLKAENEELKKTIEYKDICYSELKNKSNWAYERTKSREKKYKQALDEIEKTIKHCKKVDICYKCRFAEKCVDETGFSHSFYNLAIDIINKAKDGE